jgi:RND superfamily putative drug exporter
MQAEIGRSVVFASIGRFCFRHRRAVALAWVVALLVGFGVGGQVFNRLIADQGSSSAESVRGYRLLTDSAPYGSRILALVDGAPVDDPAVGAAVTRAAQATRELPDVARVVDVYTTPLPELAATDGRASLVSVDLGKKLSKTAETRVVAAVERELGTIPAAVPGSTVRFGGNLLLNREVNEQVQRDTQFGEYVALPITLIVMIVIFGGFVAAGIPFLGAMASVAGALLSLLGFSYLVDLDSNVVPVTTVLGLGLSIDYALLMVSRYREERGAGRSAADAIERTSATAGRTITFSALTVATSLSGLFLFDSSIFRAIGAAGVSVVVIALVAGLTLVPALLGLFGRRIRVPSEPLSDDGFFARLAEGVQRRRWLVGLGIAGLLLLTAAPFLGARFENGGANLLPASFQSRQVAEVVTARFPGSGTDPVTVVARADAAGLAAYAAKVATRPGVATVHPPEQRGPGISVVEVVPVGTSQGPAAQRLVGELRAVGADVPTYVTGNAAFLVDFKHEIATRMPAAIAVIAVVTFVLLFAMTGSVLVPIKALVMNVLSLGASFGALVLVFQQGHLSGLLGFDSPGALETWVPVIVFAFAFGLSMDYEVFLLSRIKELYDAGVPNDRAVVLGLQRSGRIITSAALLVVIVFAGFGAGQMLGIKQMGLALALAVFVDATLVRCLLVPATMTLLGDRNWWAPAPLRRLHDRFGIRESAAAPDTVDMHTRTVV